MNLEKLKDTARKYEQKEDWRRAIDVYLKAIHEFESGKDQHPDLSLYNRVGDLYMKVNDTAAAVRSYERAADLYTEQGFLNNAVALCGKILRVNPSRTQIYFKLAQIHARKNMVVDAKRHLVEYLDRMNRAGQLDEAFQAVKIFADQFSGNQEIRLMLIELLRAASRDEEAREQLEKLAGELEARGDRVGALRTREQIEALANGISAAGGTPAEEPAASGLVFLDTGANVAATPPRLEPIRDTPSTPVVSVPPTPVVQAPPTPVPAAPPVLESPYAPPLVPPTPAPAESDLAEEGESEASPPLEFLDVGAPLEGPVASGLVVLEPLVEEPSFADPGAGAAEGMLLGDIELTATEPPEVETVEPVDGLVRVAPGVQDVLAHEGIELMLEPSFDETPEIEARPLEGLELIAADLEAHGLEGRADEPSPSDASEVVVDLGGATGDVDADGTTEVAAEAIIDEFSLDDDLASDSIASEPSDEAEPAAAEEFSVEDFPDAADGAAVESAPADFAVVAGEPWQPRGAARSVEELEERILENPDDPEAHRELGEALLLEGDTSRAVDEFELALSGYEADGDQERAETLVALLITLHPDDVRFYQRRVEYAYRSGDRDQLLGAYLDLADVLARVQAEDKAIAVYWRVLEHDPENARAQLALQLLGVLDLDGEGTPDGVAVEDEPAAADEEPEADAVAAWDGQHVAEAESSVAHVTAPFVPPVEAPDVPESTVDEEAAPAAAAPPAEPLPPRPLPSLGDFVDLRALVVEEDERPRDTRMTGRQVDPTGDEQRDFEEMLAQFKKGIEENVDLDDYQAHYDLGIAFKEMGLLDEAVAEFQRALRAPEGRLRTSEALGICFYEKGQFAVAEAVLRRAVETLPGGDDDKIGLIYWYARSAEEQGKAELARALYERALAVDIRFQDINERINRLMTGRQ